MIKTLTHVGDELLKTVEHGLSASNKQLPSWLLYNAEGDKLFQRIMDLPSYYITKCEYEILVKYKADLFSYFKPFKEFFQIIELGSGDGIKTEILIHYLTSEGIKFAYRPVDISTDALEDLTKRLYHHYPGIDLRPSTAEYFEALHNLDDHHRKLILFLGANIGNFTVRQSFHFLKKLSDELLPSDYAIIGFDLKKDPRLIERAYDDEEGVTRKFNLNLLKRLNNEVGACFDVSAFDHFESYDPQTGTAKSFLVSLKDQDVFIGGLQRYFHFAQWETIHTEISQKYDLLMLERILHDAHLEIVDLFFDSQHYFCDVLVKKRILTTA